MKYRIIFFGSSEFAIPSLEKLISSGLYDVLAVVTQPDKPVGRKYALSATPVKCFAKHHNIPIFEDDLNKLSSLISSMNIDLGIVIAYGAILPLALFSVPRRGFINLHASLLPKYRGASPIQTALLHGDIETGVSIIQVNQWLDRGEILAQKLFSIQTFDTSLTLSKSLSELGAFLIIETLPRIFHDELVPLKQDDSLANYSRKIRRDDGIIQWNKQSAESIISMYRAYTPWPGISTVFQKKRLKITSLVFSPYQISSDFLSQFSSSRNQNSLQPGAVIRVDEKHIGVVVNGDKAVILKRVQLEGKNEMDIESFIRGYPKFIGETLFS